MDALDEDVFKRERFSKVFAMGDFHGDLTAAVVCMSLLARVATYDPEVGEWRWVAPERTAVVILGDTVDRHRPGVTVLDANRFGPGEQQREEEELSSMILTLAYQAPRNGGRVFRLMGNHEMWNTVNLTTDNFFVEHYASPAALKSQGGVKGRNASFQRGEMHELLGVSTCGTDRGGSTVCSLPKAVVQIGGWAFVHGGIAPQHIKLTPEGEHVFRHANALLEQAWDAAVTNSLDRDDPKWELLFRLEGDGQSGWSGMLWDRHLGFGPKEGERSLTHEEWCPAYAAQMLRDYTAHNAQWGLPALEHAVVAHCVQDRGAYFDLDAEYGLEMPIHKVDDPDPQSPWEAALSPERRRRVVFKGDMVRPVAQPTEKKGEFKNSIQGINAECDGVVWRIDVGQSRAMQRAEAVWRNYAVSHDVEPRSFVNAVKRACRPSVLCIDMTGPTDDVSVLSTKLPLENGEVLP